MPCFWFKVINKLNIWVPKYWPDFLFIHLCTKSCLSVNARGCWRAFGGTRKTRSRITEQNYRAFFLLSEETLPLSYCPEPITSVWDWALLSKDIVGIYTNLLLQSLEQALFNCAHRWSLLAVGSENSWRNHDGAGFDPNIYTTCQILIHEIRNSPVFPLCDAILRLHFDARSGSAKFRI